MEWIDIEKQVPGFDIPILVYGEGRITIARLFSVTATSQHQRLDFYKCDSGTEELWITVTHWMPLPEPVKEKK